MNIKFPLASSSWDDAEIAAMSRVIDSGFYTMGSEVEKFERAFARYFESRYAVMANSGSSANLLMTAALFFTKTEKRLKKGDQIIVPALGWATSYAPLHQYGLHLKFVDIDLGTLNYDLNALRCAIDKKTKAILAINLLGNPNDFFEIDNIIDGRNIIILEDNCESMGASLQGRYSGTFGLMGTFSCFFSHHISTMEGGVILTDDEEMYHIMLSLRSHGWTRNLPTSNLVTGKKSENNFEESWRFVLPGYNLRPTELSGAIGVEQLKKLPDILAGRRKNAKELCEIICDHPDLMIQKETGISSWFGFSLVIRPSSKMKRITLVKKINNLGFETRPVVSGNFAKQPVMRFFDHSIASALDNAEYVDSHGILVGNHHYSLSEAFDALKEI